MERSTSLAAALVDVIADLRLVDAADLIAYIRASKWANIADLVQSSTELFFRDGAIIFSCSGEFDVSWGEPPSIMLDMEFQHDDVTAFFTLTLASEESIVQLHKLWFATPATDEIAATSAFRGALSDARIRPMAKVRPDADEHP